MSAYVIILRERTRDSDELTAYAQAAKAARTGHTIRPLAYYGPHEVLEGPATEGVVIFEFRDAAAAHAWYDSPAYREARRHRHLGADCRVLIVEGVAQA